MRSVVFLNGPCSVRYSTTRCAAFAPTRGSRESCDASAVLMLTTPLGEVVASSAKMGALIAVSARTMKRTGRVFRMVFFSFRFLVFSLLFLLLAVWYSHKISRRFAVETASLHHLLSRASQFK